MRTHFILLTSVITLFILSLATISIFPAEKNVGQALSAIKDTAVLDIPLEHQPDTAHSYTTYVYGKALIGKKTHTDLTYHIQDTLTTNKLVVSDNGLMQSRFTSYPYGKPLTKESFASQNPRYTYTGKEDDGHLMYYGARYMDARTGRFASVDQAGAALASYTYASDNPLVLRDPDGNKDGFTINDASFAINVFSYTGAALLGRAIDDDYRGMTESMSLGMAAGTALYGAKAFAGGHATSDYHYLLAGIVGDLAASVESNAIRGDPAFSRIQMSYLIFDFRYEDGKVTTGLNLMKAGTLLGMGIAGKAKVDWGRSFRTGVPQLIGKDFGAGGAAQPGGIMINKDIKNKQSFASQRMLLGIIERHEYVHTLQFKGLRGLASGFGNFGINPIQVSSGLKLTGEDELTGIGLGMFPFHIGLRFSGQGSTFDGTASAYHSKYNWWEYEAFELDEAPEIEE